jgi:ZIP family zinc transporter
MMYVSLVEIFPKAQVALITEFGETQGKYYTVLAFFGGMFLIALIDKFIPHFENPHERIKIEDLHDLSEEREYQKRSGLYRTGLFAAVAIAIHNFPEGLATFASALKDPELGISIAIAIAIHNIPEGIAVSIPIYYATHNRKKAFLYSFLSGLAEPLGAIVGFFLFYSYFTDGVFGILFAGVGGIMVFISLDELLPAAKEYGEHHLSIYGLLAGMAVMAASLLLFI